METKTSKLSALIPWPPRVTHVGLSLTRIAYAAAIFLDMGQVYRWRHTSFTDSNIWVAQFAVPAAMVALALFGAGLATRLSAIAVFILVRLVYHELPETYALDHITQLVTFVFVFAPSPRALAVDVILHKAESEPLELLPAWFSLALFLCIEVVYANSVLNKLRTVVWRDGLTFWLTMTLPHFSADRLPGVLKIPFVLRMSTYIALGLETLFPLVLVRPLRRWVLLVAVALHLGIAIFLPIPLFGLGYTALFLCFVDWTPIVRRLRRKGVSGIPLGFARGSRLGYALPLFILLGEILATIPPRIAPLANVRPALKFLGLANYGVYLDFHFTIPKPIVRVVATSDGRAIDLPSFDERGYPEVTGRYWSMMTIGEMRWHSGDAEGDEAMSRFLNGALTRKGISDAEFTVYGRDVSIPLRMTPDLESSLAARPWKIMATGAFRAGHMDICWNAETLTTSGRLD